MSEVLSKDLPVLMAGRYFLVSNFQMGWSIPPHGSTLMGIMVVLLPSLSTKLFLQEQLRVLQNSQKHS